MKLLKISLFVIVCLIISCNRKLDYYNVSVQSNNGNFNAVIEIPAGTNKKIEYNNLSKTFEVDLKNGEDRIVQFLPYIGNYGYIPSTFSNPKEGGDGDALDVLVLSENVETGTIIEIEPIAVLKLLDKGEIDYKIIAIPANKATQIIKVDLGDNFLIDYPAVKTMIELWFLNYNKEDVSIIEGWGNREEAIYEIEKNKRK
ncbi:MAG: inorganic diphosphatase [Flavobacteriaceae bacterium]|jgi:inorganic pyrophosphatase|tara:strand:+ start:10334 stop:10933 length:600 start_codon:yes stop_codon:yes gene_type:complete